MPKDRNRDKSPGGVGRNTPSQRDRDKSPVKEGSDNPLRRLRAEIHKERVEPLPKTQPQRSQACRMILHSYGKAAELASPAHQYTQEFAMVCLEAGEYAAEHDMWPDALGLYGEAFRTLLGLSQPCLEGSPMLAARQGIASALNQIRRAEQRSERGLQAGRLRFETLCHHRALLLSLEEQYRTQPLHNIFGEAHAYLGSTAYLSGRFDLSVESFRKYNEIKRHNRLPTIAAEKHSGDAVQKLHLVLQTERREMTQALWALSDLQLEEFKMRQDLDATTWSTSFALFNYEPHCRRVTEHALLYPAATMSPPDAAAHFKLLVLAANHAVQASKFSQAEGYFRDALTLAETERFSAAISKYEEIVLRGSMGFVCFMRAQKETVKGSLEYQFAMVQAVPLYKRAIDMIQQEQARQQALPRDSKEIRPMHDMLESAVQQLGTVASNVERHDAALIMLRRCRDLKQSRGAKHGGITTSITTVEALVAARDTAAVEKGDRMLDVHMKPVYVPYDRRSLGAATQAIDAAFECMHAQNRRMPEAEEFALEALATFNALARATPALRGHPKFFEALRCAGKMFLERADEAVGTPASGHYSLLALTLLVRAANVLPEDDDRAPALQFELGTAYASLDCFENGVQSLNRSIIAYKKTEPQRSSKDAEAKIAEIEELCLRTLNDEVDPSDALLSDAAPQLQTAIAARLAAEERGVAPSAPVARRRLSQISGESRERRLSVAPGDIRQQAHAVLGVDNRMIQHVRTLRFMSNSLELQYRDRARGLEVEQRWTALEWEQDAEELHRRSIEEAEQLGIDLGVFDLLAGLIRLREEHDRRLLEAYLVVEHCAAVEDVCFASHVFGFPETDEFFALLRAELEGRHAIEAVEVVAEEEHAARIETFRVAVDQEVEPQGRADAYLDEAAGWQALQHQWARWCLAEEERVGRGRLEEEHTHTGVEIHETSDRNGIDQTEVRAREWVFLDSCLPHTALWETRQRGELLAEEAAEWRLLLSHAREAGKEARTVEYRAERQAFEDDAAVLRAELWADQVAAFVTVASPALDALFQEAARAAVGAEEEQSFSEYAAERLLAEARAVVQAELAVSAAEVEEVTARSAAMADEAEEWAALDGAVTATFIDFFLERAPGRYEAEMQQRSHTWAEMHAACVAEATERAVLYAEEDEVHVLGLEAGRTDALLEEDQARLGLLLEEAALAADATAGSYALQYAAAADVTSAECAAAVVADAAPYLEAEEGLWRQEQQRLEVSALAALEAAAIAAIPEDSAAAIVASALGEDVNVQQEASRPTTPAALSVGPMDPSRMATLKRLEFALGVCRRSGRDATDDAVLLALKCAALCVDNTETLPRALAHYADALQVCQARALPLKAGSHHKAAVTGFAKCVELVAATDAAADAGHLLGAALVYVAAWEADGDGDLTPSAEIAEAYRCAGATAVALGRPDAAAEYFEQQRAALELRGERTTKAQYSVDSALDAVPKDQSTDAALRWKAANLAAEQVPGRWAREVEERQERLGLREVEAELRAAAERSVPAEEYQERYKQHLAAATEAEARAAYPQAEMHLDSAAVVGAMEGPAALLGPWAQPLVLERLGAAIQHRAETEDTEAAHHRARSLGPLRQAVAAVEVMPPAAKDPAGRSRAAVLETLYAAVAAAARGADDDEALVALRCAREQRKLRAAGGDMAAADTTELDRGCEELAVVTTQQAADFGDRCTARLELELDGAGAAATLTANDAAAFSLDGAGALAADDVEGAEAALLNAVKVFDADAVRDPTVTQRQEYRRAVTQLAELYAAQSAPGGDKFAELALACRLKVEALVDATGGSGAVAQAKADTAAAFARLGRGEAARRRLSHARHLDPGADVAAAVAALEAPAVDTADHPAAISRLHPVAKPFFLTERSERQKAEAAEHQARELLKTTAAAGALLVQRCAEADADLAVFAAETEELSGRGDGMVDEEAARAVVAAHFTADMATARVAEAPELTAGAHETLQAHFLTLHAVHCEEMLARRDLLDDGVGRLAQQVRVVHGQAYLWEDIAIMQTNAHTEEAAARLALDLLVVESRVSAGMCDLVLESQRELLLLQRRQLQQRELLERNQRQRLYLGVAWAEMQQLRARRELVLEHQQQWVDTFLIPCEEEEADDRFFLEAMWLEGCAKIQMLAWSNLGTWEAVLLSQRMLLREEALTRVMELSRPMRREFETIFLAQEQLHKDPPDPAVMEITDIFHKRRERRHRAAMEWADRQLLFDGTEQQFVTAERAQQRTYLETQETYRRYCVARLIGDDLLADAAAFLLAAHETTCRELAASCNAAMHDTALQILTEGIGSDDIFSSVLASPYAYTLHGPQ